MAHIIVMGAGIGGLPLAYEAREKLGKTHDITVINTSEEFHFLPSNPWLLVGWRRRGDIAFPIGPYLQKKGINFIAQPVTHIDAEHNQVTVRNGETLGYDYLVITTGPKLAFDEVPGAGPHGGHTHSVCAVDHAQTGYEAYEAFCEDPGPIVVGAMPMASCFGPVYESAFIIDADLRKRKLRKHVPMTMITSEPYVGHMGLGGVGDSKGMLESELRNRHIKWITNARTTRIERDHACVEECNEQGEVIKEHQVPFKFAMTLPAFRGVDPVAAVEGLCNPRGFVLIDANQRSPRYRNIFSAGVCVAIPPVEATPVPTGVPKTGYMIESMVSAIVQNIQADLAGQPATAKGTWNAVCLADMGDTGAAFVALPQIPPRNVNWFKKGKWVHYAKIAFEKYFIHKIKTGASEPVYEKYVMRQLGIERLE